MGQNYITESPRRLVKSASSTSSLLAGLASSNVPANSVELPTEIEFQVVQVDQVKDPSYNRLVLASPSSIDSQISAVTQLLARGTCMISDFVGFHTYSRSVYSDNDTEQLRNSVNYLYLFPKQCVNAKVIVSILTTVE